MSYLSVSKIVLQIPDTMDLKQKRRVLKSLISRIKNKFNVAVAEVAHHDQWQLATVACVAISNDSQHVQSIASALIDFVQNDSHGDFIFLDHSIEIIPGI